MRTAAAETRVTVTPDLGVQTPKTRSNRRTENHFGWAEGFAVRLATVPSPFSELHVKFDPLELDLGASMLLL